MYVHFWSANDFLSGLTLNDCSQYLNCLKLQTCNTGNSDIQLTYYNHINVFVYPVYPVISVFSGQIRLGRAEKTEQTPKPSLQIASQLRFQSEQASWLTWTPKGSRQRFGAFCGASASCVSLALILHCLL